MNREARELADEYARALESYLAVRSEAEKPPPESVVEPLKSTPSMVTVNDRDGANPAPVSVTARPTR